MLVTNTSCTSKFFSVNPDGVTGSCFDMASSAGKILVITDVFWSATGTAGNTCVGLIQAGSGGFVSFASNATAAADGFAGKTEHLTTGAKTTWNPQFSVNGATCTNSGGAILQGYLLPNQ